MQEEFIEGMVPVITATIAFGMGIDKSSVRFVAHWNLPRSVTNYYQESGRAGRDGRDSFARIFYSAKDRDVQEGHLNKESKKKQSEEREERVSAQMDSLKLMIMYCESATCRHAVFSRFFGDSQPACGGKCDSCKNIGDVKARLEEFKNKDITVTISGKENEAKQEFVDVIREKIFG